MIFTRNKSIHSYVGSPSLNCAVMEYSMYICMLVPTWMAPKQNKSTKVDDSWNLNHSIAHWNNLWPVSMSKPSKSSFPLSSRWVCWRRETKNEKPMMHVKDMPDQGSIVPRWWGHFGVCFIIFIAVHFGGWREWIWGTHQGILHLLNSPNYWQLSENGAIPELFINYPDAKCPQIFGQIISTKEIINTHY